MRNRYAMRKIRELEKYDGNEFTHLKLNRLKPKK